MKNVFGFVLSAVIYLCAHDAWAQGQDSTPTERDIMVLAEMLPGVYDNQEQVYFDGRTNVRQEAKHERMNSKIVRTSCGAKLSSVAIN